jgi:hypothetical protein
MFNRMNAEEMKQAQEKYLKNKESRNATNIEETEENIETE